ncbi:MAG TPA: adenylyltransferase/cytidyltransferase family protein [Candidatus Limiplasma sp.]|nr:adenylyltransferase/cytidyltransferase family protein [Candidatus Limiplasma sp.]HRX07919.1 adenylyltransferase/cytidyltransferase family protein [Candidatus Limiplasma sp.]
MRICSDDTIRTETSVLALGMFDGVHLGHQALLNKARELADRFQAPMVVMTFDRHPLNLIAPGMAPPMLTTPAERMRLLEQYGADVVCVSPFTEELRDMAPEAFVRLLVDHWHPKAVVIGYNYNFGRHGTGTADTMRALGATFGFETAVVPEVRLNGERVSSTRIRQLLVSGDTAGAEALLGRTLTGGKGK